MCDTTHGFELTRLSCVDTSGNVLLDTLVRPANRITNYRTMFSGISEDVLEGVTVSLRQVQAALVKLCGPTTILVGHSLENDLIALRLVYTKCVDTSYLYPHPRGFPLRRKLRLLSEEYLKRKIQGQGQGQGGGRKGKQGGNGLGHDSVEDAMAALRLAQLKVEKGPSFGVQKGSLPKEPLLAVAARELTKATKGSKVADLAPARQLLLTPCAYDANGVQACAAGDAAEVVDCGSNRAVLDRAVAALAADADSRAVTPESSPFFMYMGISLCSSTTETGGTNEIIAGESGGRDMVNARTAVSQIEAALSGGPVNALLVVGTQCDLRPGRALTKLRHACSEPTATLSWTSQQESDLKEAVQRSNMCRMSFRVVNGAGASDLHANDEGGGDEEDEGKGSEKAP